MSVFKKCLEDLEDDGIFIDDVDDADSMIIDDDVVCMIIDFDGDSSDIT